MKKNINHLMSYCCLNKHLWPEHKFTKQKKVHASMLTQISNSRYRQYEKNTRMLRFQVLCGIVRWQHRFRRASGGDRWSVHYYVYLYWFMFIVRPAQWQPRKNDPLDYWSQLNVNWKLGNDVSAILKPRKCGTGTCTICGNHAR